MLKSLFTETFFARQLYWKSCANLFYCSFWNHNYYPYNISCQRNNYSGLFNKPERNSEQNVGKSSQKSVDCGCSRRFQLLSRINDHQTSDKSAEELLESILDHVTYERVCAETLDGLNDYFEQLLENITDDDKEYLKQFQNNDISYSVSTLFTYPNEVMFLNFKFIAGWCVDGKFGFEIWHLRYQSADT